MKSALSLAMFALATSRVKGSAAVLDTFCNELAGTDECVWSSPPNNGVYTIEPGYTRFELAVPVTLQDSNLYAAVNGYVSHINGGSSDNIIRGDETGTTNFYYQSDLFSLFGGNGWRTPGDTVSDQSGEQIQHFVVKHIGPYNLLWSPPNEQRQRNCAAGDSESCQALLAACTC